MKTPTFCFLDKKFNYKFSSLKFGSPGSPRIDVRRRRELLLGGDAGRSIFFLAAKFSKWFAKKSPGSSVIVFAIILFSISCESGENLLSSGGSEFVPFFSFSCEVDFWLRFGVLDWELARLRLRARRMFISKGRKLYCSRFSGCSSWADRREVFSLVIGFWLARSELLMDLLRSLFSMLAMLLLEPR